MRDIYVANFKSFRQLYKKLWLIFVLSILDISPPAKLRKHRWNLSSSGNFYWIIRRHFPPFLIRAEVSSWHSCSLKLGDLQKIQICRKILFPMFYLIPAFLSCDCVVNNFHIVCFFLPCEKFWIFFQDQKITGGGRTFVQYGEISVWLNDKLLQKTAHPILLPLIEIVLSYVFSQIELNTKKYLQKNFFWMSDLGSL